MALGSSVFEIMFNFHVVVFIDVRWTEKDTRQHAHYVLFMFGLMQLVN